MSITTELVFITTTKAAGRQFADVFERAKHEMFGKTTNTYSWRPEPIDWFTPDRVPVRYRSHGRQPTGHAGRRDVAGRHHVVAVQRAAGRTGGDNVVIKDPEPREWADVMLRTVPFDMKADSTRWMVLAVRQLLEIHHPSDDEGLSHGYLCRACCDGWPCDVYTVIKIGADHAIEGTEA